VNHLLKGVNLYLIGMMGVGKTTVGQLLAKQLNYRFVDTDSLIEQVTGQTISTLFATDGEEAFREIESQVLHQVCGYTRMAIATGGGIILKSQNWGYLQHGVVVWLDASPEQLYERLRQDTSRPLLQTTNPLETLRSLYEKRRPFYAQADLRVAIHGDDTPDDVVNRVLSELPNILRPEVLGANHNADPNDD
jgi:shikimate kinase